MQMQNFHGLETLIRAIFLRPVQDSHIECFNLINVLIVERISWRFIDRARNLLVGMAVARRGLLVALDINTNVLASR